MFLNVAAEHKCLKRGVKEVVKSIRRGNKGYVYLNVIRLVHGGLSTYDSWGAQGARALLVKEI